MDFHLDMLLTRIELIFVVAGTATAVFIVKYEKSVGNTLKF